MAEVNSDLQSEAEELPRKRKPVKRLYSSSDEEIENDPFPRPPTVPKQPRGMFYS